MQASISVEASRFCSGNFIDGGTWQPTNSTACDLGDVGLQLCSAVVRRLKTVTFVSLQIHSIVLLDLSLSMDKSDREFLLFCAK